MTAPLDLTQPVQTRDGRADCLHTTTSGRENESGSWCVRCGTKVYAVHDRPCGECRHHKRLGPAGSGGMSLCRRHLMAVTIDMHVSYSTLRPDGLCFEGPTCIGGAVVEIDEGDGLAGVRE